VSRTRAGLLVAAGCGSAALVAAVVVPQVLGMAGLPGPAQLVALRGLVGMLLGVLAVVLLVGAALLRRAARRRPEATLQRDLAGLVAVVAAVALLGSGVEAALLAARGGWDRGDMAPAVGEGEVVVLVQNTLTTLDAAQLATLIVDRGADVVVLPETSAATAKQTAALVRTRSGHDLRAFTSSPGASGIASTSLLLDSALGAFAVTEVLPGPLGSFIAAEPDGMTVAAIHAYPPLGRHLDTWRTTTTAAVDLCGTASIVAGDFNATIDHPAFNHLGGCIDTAQATGRAAVGTWPVSLPPSLGAPIDHVLIDPTVWHVVRTTVLEPPTGSDHRTFEAVLRPIEE